jgi:hypothetical protein
LYTIINKIICIVNCLSLEWVKVYIPYYTSFSILQVNLSSIQFKMQTSIDMVKKASTTMHWNNVWSLHSIRKCQPLHRASSLNT